MRIIGNNEQTSQIGAKAPTGDFCWLFLVILNYSDYASRNNKIIENN